MEEFDPDEAATIQTINNLKFAIPRLLSALSYDTFSTIWDRVSEKMLQSILLYSIHCLFISEPFILQLLY